VKITQIRFFSHEKNAGFILVCEDDWIGIVKDDKKRFFKRGLGKNTGLGLVLSREIPGITGIKICETGVPGKGARFEMAVPGSSFSTHTLCKIIIQVEKIPAQTRVLITIKNFIEVPGAG
jgi:sensor histidine kinase regulating citrate/malate metabolism